MTSGNYYLENEKDELFPKASEPLKYTGKTYITHGFLPGKLNFKCIFIAAGPEIRRGSPFAICKWLTLP